MAGKVLEVGYEVTQSMGTESVSFGFVAPQLLYRWWLCKFSMRLTLPMGQRRQLHLMPPSTQKHTHIIRWNNQNNNPYEYYTEDRFDTVPPKTIIRRCDIIWPSSLLSYLIIFRQCMRIDPGPLADFPHRPVPFDAVPPWTRAHHTSSWRGGCVAAAPGFVCRLSGFASWLRGHTWCWLERRNSRL